jgi:hypothetical protein
MGASSSVPISSVMNILLRVVLKKLPFEVPFCFRFVDLLLSVPDDQVETTLQIFNSYNDSIKFTETRMETFLQFGAPNHQQQSDKFLRKPLIHHETELCSSPNQQDLQAHHETWYGILEDQQMF